ncbi:hypothetical protein GCM10009844_08070 [Nocardioides koreensis]|uniref:Uncharacterized protein n=1 Tax=Nocardioides koreensis TaxID=433651 RepID=A0ABN2ZAL7_9ACTN
MATDAVDEPTTRPLLTLGRVHRLRVQVGYRARPDGPAYQQFLLDVPVPGLVAQGAFDEARALAALEPVVYAGAETPRHYSIHEHRWHTSWGPSPGALEIGLLVTTGTPTAATSEAPLDGVVQAFRDLLELVGRPGPVPASRDAAVQRARTATATAYALDADALSLSTEEHHLATGSWRLRLRTTSGEGYDVVVGLVDGYAGSVRVRHAGRIEVFDSVGSE